MISTFKEMTKAGAAIERKKTLDAEAQEMLKVDKSRKLTLADTASRDDEVEASGDFSAGDRSNSPEPFPGEKRKSDNPPPLPPRRSGLPSTEEDDEAAFQRDLDLATKLSLAEQQGYERGLKHAQASEGSH